MSQVAPPYGVQQDQARLETMALALEATRDFRVLRRFSPREWYATAVDRKGDEEPLRLGLIVDLETTGLDPVTDKAIEIALTQFEFDGNGVIYGVTARHSCLEDPGFYLSPEIVELTGIRDADVTGQHFDDIVIEELVQSSQLVIAFKAGFDRPFLERRFPCFVEKHFGCAMEEVPWDRFGGRGKKQLDYLLERVCGEFYDGHRAQDDCDVTLHVLAAPRRTIQLDVDGGKTPFQWLLESVRSHRRRIYAVQAPYEKKDVLKRRGYHWSDGTGDRPKAWWIDKPQVEVNAEMRFLSAEIYQCEPVTNILVQSVSAKDLYSERL